MSSLAPSFDRVEPFQCTIPAGTLSTAPVERDTSFNPGRVVRLQVLVPPGHNGNTGFAIAQARQPVHPDRTGAFIIASNETFDWEIEDPAGAGSWSLFGYNTDANPHSFYVRYYIVELSRERMSAAPIATPLAL